jgi:serine/threonine-protein kinase
VFLAETPGGTPTVKVLDFGIAAGEPVRSGSVKLTALDRLLGSPAYMSPEQLTASHDVDARSDIWSMGALLYEVITGQIPFRGDTDLAMFAAAMTKPPLPLRAHLGEDLPRVESPLRRPPSRRSGRRSSSGASRSTTRSSRRATPPTWRAGWATASTRQDPSPTA